MKYLSVLLLLIGFNARAQNFKKSLSAEEYTSTSAYGYKIPIKKYRFFPYHLARYNRSIDSNVLYLCLENQEYHRYLISMDILADTIIYAHYIKDEMTNVTGYRDYYVAYNKRSTYVYSSTTGDILWSFEGRFLQVDVQNNTGIDIHGTAYDMYTGKEKWKQPIDLSYGIGQFWRPDSNCLLLVGNGLQLINTKTGTGWYQKVNTGALVDTEKYIGDYLINDFFGTHQRLRNSMVWHANSNIDKDSNLYYFAGIDEVIAVNTTGIVKWKKQLPSKSGYSFLEVGEHAVLLVSTGYVGVSDYVSLFNRPFIAAFDKNNGNLLYYKPLPKKTVIFDYQLNKDRILLTSSEAISAYDIQTGALKNSILLDKHDNTFRGYGYFLNGEYIFADTSFDCKNSFEKVFVSNSFLRDRSGDILRLNYTLDTFDVIDQKDIYYRYKLKNDIVVTTNFKGKKVFIDKKDKRLLNFGSKPDIQVNNKLLFIETSHMYIADLSGL